MNRYITSTIRFILDGILPPIIRDNYFFMYPLFYIWFKGYKGHDVSLYMNLKSKVHDMSDEEFSNMYRDVEWLAMDRPTDMNSKCMEYIIENYDKSAKTMLDVGCGRGYWVERIAGETKLKVTGLDVFDSLELKNAKYVKGDIENLPFQDNSFDIVFSSHMIEHVRDLERSIEEMKRVAKKQVIAVTPRQRYNYYTLDMHLNFFPYKETLTSIFKLKKQIVINFYGDWVYIGKK